MTWRGSLWSTAVDPEKLVVHPETEGCVAVVEATSADLFIPPSPFLPANAAMEQALLTAAVPKLPVKMGTLVTVELATVPDMEVEDMR